jgi:N-methylhydantoinase B
VLATKHEGIPVPPGTVFEINAGGGGGWGDPAARTPEERAKDRRDGFVTRRKRGA